MTVKLAVSVSAASIIGIAAFVAGCSSSEPAAPATVDVSGVVETSGRDVPAGCIPLLSGVKEGDDIVISGSSGQKLGIGSLGPATIKPDTTDLWVTCVYPFSIPNVPLDQPVYTITIGDVENGEDFSQEQIKKPLTLEVS